MNRRTILKNTKKELEQKCVVWSCLGADWSNKLNHNNGDWGATLQWSGRNTCTKSLNLLLKIAIRRFRRRMELIRMNMIHTCTHICILRVFFFSLGFMLLLNKQLASRAGKNNSHKSMGRGSGWGAKARSIRTYKLAEDIQWVRVGVVEFLRNHVDIKGCVRGGRAAIMVS